MPILGTFPRNATDIDLTDSCISSFSATAGASARLARRSQVLRTRRAQTRDGTRFAEYAMRAHSDLLQRTPPQW